MSQEKKVSAMEYDKSEVKEPAISSKEEQAVYAPKTMQGAPQNGEAGQRVDIQKELQSASQSRGENLNASMQQAAGAGQQSYLGAGYSQAGSVNPNATMQQAADTWQQSGTYPNAAYLKAAYQQSAAAPQQGMPMNAQMPQGVYAPRPQPVPFKKKVPQKHQLMRENYNFFGVATIIYALFYTFCLYENTSGITAPFFTAGALCYFALCLKKLGVPWKKDNWLYIAAIELVGINLCLTQDSVLIIFDYIALFLLTICGLLHAVYDDKRWAFGKYFSAIFENVFGSIGYLFQGFADIGHYDRFKKANLATGEPAKKEKIGKYIWIGVLCCLPILAIVLALLSSADGVFHNLLENVFKNIEIDEDLVGILFMIFWVFLGSYALLCRVTSEGTNPNVKERPQYNAIIAITMNVMLAVVYLVFCIIQLAFLFQGENMKLPEGYTYSSYARQGFFQLLFVCLINMVLVLICTCYFGKNKLLKAVLTFITACTYIMIASSALRMKMYIEIYQLSYLRLLVLWGLAIIFFVMSGILVYIYKKEFPLFRYSVAVVTVLYLALAFARPEYVIASYNLNDRFLEQYKAGGSASQEYGEIDFTYICDLSCDAAPVVAQAVKKVNTPEFTEHFSYDSSYCNFKDYEKESYRKFNFSAYAAEQALKGLF